MPKKRLISSVPSSRMRLFMSWRNLVNSSWRPMADLLFGCGLSILRIRSIVISGPYPGKYTMSQPTTTHPASDRRSRALRRRKPAARRLLAVLAIGLAIVISPRPAAADTAFVLKSGEALLLAKNHDGPAGDGYLFVNKRNVVKQAFGGTDSPPLRWVSKYGSVT